LPTMVDTGTPGCNMSFSGGTDCGYNVLTTSGGSVYSEMASLWYDTLGNKSVCDPTTSTVNSCSLLQVGSGLTNTGDFLNFRPDYFWTGAASAIDVHEAWSFAFHAGIQSLVTKSAGTLTAMAVRDGDVAVVVNDVPEPQSLLLTGVALAALCAVRRRNAARTKSGSR